MDAVFDLLSPPRWVTEAAKSSGSFRSGDVLQGRRSESAGIARAFVRLPWREGEVAVLENLEVSCLFL